MNEPTRLLSGSVRSGIRDSLTGNLKSYSEFSSSRPRSRAELYFPVMFAPDGGAIVRGGAIKAHRGALSTTVALIAVAGFGTPAVAATAAPVSVNASGGTAPADEAPVEGEPVEGEYDEDLPLPDEPPEVKFPDDEPDMPDGLECKPGWFFKITKNKKNTMSVKYHTFVENKKNYTIDYKFTSKKSGTTEVGASVAVSADIGVKILGSIKAEIQASAKKSWTSEIGIETYGKVKAKSTVKGNYGISKENVYGYKYYRGSACQKSNKQHMTAWAPYREGWVVS